MNPTTPMTFTARTSEEPAMESSYLSVGPGLITQAGVPTEEQFTSIRERFGDPRANVKPDDYYVFRMIASGDGLDSYYTRQDTATSFPNFVRDLQKGQSVMGSHLMATFSYGSSYGGEIVPADEDRPEYEGTFYPQWDQPDLRTKQWLVGDYFMGRGISVNNQSQDDLIRAIELGTIRKASISFMVGEYVCGLDGKSLIPSMFGPMPDEECNHFPGISYDGHVGWALMKHNTLVETSLVYKNASPSSMLLRKAESLATRGVLTTKQIDTLEGRFQIRLPRFEQHIWTPNATTTATTANPTITNVTVSGTPDVRFDAQVQEDTDMANRPRSGDTATRELVREALTAEAEPQQDETEVSSEAPEGAEATTASAETPTNPEDKEVSEAPEGLTTNDADADPKPDPADNADNAGDAPAAPAAGASDEAEADDTKADDTKADVEPDATTAAAPDADRTTEEAGEADATPETEEVAAETVETDQTESTREEDAVSAFAGAADRLASAIARSPDAFDSGLLAMAARAEKAVDLALIDAGCDTTVGSQVARSFEIRSKKLTEALGQPMTVETIRSLQEKAKLGDELFAELVRDAVAARIGVQGDAAFNAQRYSDVLISTRDVTYVKDEIASWQAQKAQKYTAGRQVVPRQPVDVKPSATERKTLPETPAALTSGKRQPEAASSSLIQPRTKK